MPRTHPSHKTRYSDSSIYDEVCEYCGGTDASGDMTLGSECTGDPNDPKYAHGMARDMMKENKVAARVTDKMLEQLDAQIKSPDLTSWFLKPTGNTLKDIREYVRSFQYYDSDVESIEQNIDKEIARLETLKAELRKFKTL